MGSTRCAAGRRDTIAGVTTILVPDPSLVLLIGAAGAGKTTFAARHFAPDEVLSSDAYRALVSGDEANQKVSRVAFSILHRDLERRLLAGQLTVVDATNVEPRNRRDLIRRAHAAGLPVVALVLDLPPAHRAGAQRDPIAPGGRGGRSVAARARPDHGRGRASWPARAARPSGSGGHPRRSTGC